MNTFKFLLTIGLLTVGFVTNAQKNFPYFLVGTWSNKAMGLYEHWDSIATGKIKGICYKKIDNTVAINEYLELESNGKEKNTIYDATVVGKNNGKKVSFWATHLSDSLLVFENPKHDFPKKIQYKLINVNHIEITISDGKNKLASYDMMRHSATPIFASDSTIKNPNYDVALALKTGSDDYGMKKYFWVILKTGGNESADKNTISQAFRQHLNNINKLVADKKLIVAGPLTKNDKNYRGIFIFDVATKEEVEEILQTDATIKLDILQYEIYQWYGSAALSEYLEAADKIWKLKP